MIRSLRVSVVDAVLPTQQAAQDVLGLHGASRRCSRAEDILLHARAMVDLDTRQSAGANCRVETE